jgi:hypothetical protein
MSPNPWRDIAYLMGPGLAISAQGFLYTLGIWIFGRTLPGAILGSMLSGMWAFLQPLAGAYILFGATFFRAGAGFAEWFAAQSASVQCEMMGDEVYKVYKAGRVTLDDFVGVRKLW